MYLCAQVSIFCDGRCHYNLLAVLAIMYQYCIIILAIKFDSVLHIEHELCSFLYEMSCEVSLLLFACIVPKTSFFFHVELSV